MVNREEVRHLAWLVRIELSEKEEEVYTRQIEQIIEYLNILDSISLDTKPPRNVVEYTNLRDDEAVECKEDTVSVVRNVKDRFVKAPRMV
jgi:aspartyl-tRNA(Asn)/glutamyl-tRNA(Gln) amidotransferase subunit C